MATTPQPDCTTICTYHHTEDNTYTVSVDQVWVDGVYATEAAAQLGGLYPAAVASIWKPGTVLTEAAILAVLTAGQSAPIPE